MRLAIIMSHADRSMTGAMRELHLARCLIEAGAEVEVYRIHNGPAIETERYLDGAVQTTFCPGDGEEKLAPRRVSTALVETLRQFQPDVLIFKGLNYAVNQHVFQGLGGKVPFGFIVGGAVTDPLLDRASFVLGEYRQQLQTHFPAIAARGHGFVLPKFIDLVATRPDRLPQAPLHDIINVGNFYEKRKNQGDLLQFTPNWRVALVGGGKPSDEFMKAVPERRNLYLAGRIDHLGLFALLKRSRLMVHTSTMDGLPRSVVEAMACGVPAIVYRDTVYGGLNGGLHGFLTDRETLPHAVTLLLRDETLRQEMGRRARRHVVTHHGVTAIANAARRLLRFLPGIKG